MLVIEIYFLIKPVIKSTKNSITWKVYYFCLSFFFQRDQREGPSLYFNLDLIWSINQNIWKTNLKNKDMFEKSANNR